MARKALLGHKVRRLRRDNTLSQVELARQLGISASYLNLIEHNQRPLTLPLLLKLADSFDVDLQDFSQDREARLLGELRPLDADAIVASVKKTNRLVTCEEGWPACGIGAELAAQMMELAFDWLDAPVKRVAGVDVPMPYASNLERMALPQAEDIAAAAKAVCYRD